MSAIHDYYLRLDAEKRDWVDDFIDRGMVELGERGFNAPGDDRVEVVVEALAKYIYEANLS